MAARLKRLIMECVPYEAGRGTTYDSLYANVAAYCSELGIKMSDDKFIKSLKGLHAEQCLVWFSSTDSVRPTQYGLNKYDTSERSW